LVLGASSETTSFHLIIEKPRCLLLGSIDAPHTAGSLSVREGEAVCSSVASSLFWTPSRDGTLDPVTPPDVSGSLELEGIRYLYTPGLSSKACILRCAVTNRHILVNICSHCVTHGEGRGVRVREAGTGGREGGGGGGKGRRGGCEWYNIEAEGGCGAGWMRWSLY
jgi:hypothetical protein